MAEIALPRDAASAVIVRGLATAQRAIVLVGLVVMVVVAVDVLIAHDAVDTLPLVLAPMAVLAVLTIWLLLRDSTPAAAAYLIGGCLTSVVYIVVLAREVQLDEPGPYLINRLATALVMVGALRGSARSGLVWTLGGFVAAEASLAVGFWIAGRAPEVGLSPIVAFGLATISYTVLAIARHRARQRLPDLDRLQRELELADRQCELEQRAARIVHDTVLADLAVIGVRSGDLDPGARVALERDLALVGAGTVARAPADQGAIARAPIADDLLELARQYQWSGVTVEVSGWEGLDAEVGAEVRAAVLGATRAALDNVVRHAGTDRAELVVGEREGRLVVLVVDDGVGFDDSHIADDRLGVRSSIDARLREIGGTVRVWSGDEGTTVMMSVPIRRPDDRRATTG